jgi:hypothetical protein
MSGEPMKAFGLKPSVVRLEGYGRRSSAFSGGIE